VSALGGEKFCGGCGKTRPLGEFDYSPRDRRHRTRCKPCNVAAVRAWRHRTGKHRPVNSRTRSDGLVRCCACGAWKVPGMFWTKMSRGRRLVLQSSCRPCAAGTLRRRRANAAEARAALLWSPRPAPLPVAPPAVMSEDAFERELWADLGVLSMSTWQPVRWDLWETTVAVQCSGPNGDEPTSSSAK